MFETKDQAGAIQPRELDDGDLERIQGGYKLSRLFVKSWSVSGDADDRAEES